MSTTYHLLCAVCKDALWIGQNKHLYGKIDGQELREALESFLSEHIEHPLVYVSEHQIELYNDLDIEYVLNLWNGVHVPPKSYQKSTEVERLEKRLADAEQIAQQRLADNLRLVEELKTLKERSS